MYIRHNNVSTVLVQMHQTCIRNSTTHEEKEKPLHVKRLCFNCGDDSMLPHAPAESDARTNIVQLATNL
jgi:hypothetical protein